MQRRLVSLVSLFVMVPCLVSCSSRYTRSGGGGGTEATSATSADAPPTTTTTVATEGQASVEPEAYRTAEHPDFHKDGFATTMEDGRLWVFQNPSKDLTDFETQGEPAKRVTFIGAGPGGVTVMGPDRDTVLAYLAARPGFVTRIVDGRVWVFLEGSAELEEFEKYGEPAKCVTRVNAGPLNTSIKSSDGEVIDAYLSAKPGFVTRVEDGRLWVFREGDEGLDDFLAGSEPEKHVTRVRATPGGMTVKAVQSETIEAYLIAQEGFRTIVDDDGRLWVFRAGSEEFEFFQEKGYPEKHITLVGVGPMGMTIKAPDRETAEKYLRLYRNQKI